MKKTVFLFMACLVSFSFFSCTPGEALPDDDVIVPPDADFDDSSDDSDGVTKETISVALADGTDLFSWEKTDYVAYYNGTTYVKSGAANPNDAGAKIKVSYTGTRSAYAYYPYYLVQDVSTDVNAEGMLSDLASSLTTVILPDTYKLSQVSGTAAPCPMIAVNTGEGWTFRHLGSLVKLKVNGIPVSANKLVITFDKDVTGSFTVSDPDSSTPSISTSGISTLNIVTVTFAAGTQLGGLVVNIPVPVGALSVSSVVAMQDDHVVSTLKSVISNWQATRASARHCPTTFTPSMSNIVFASGNLYTENGTLAISSNCFDHIYNATSTDDFKPGSYSAVNRTHFNWNELYFLMASTGLTTMPDKDDATTAHSGSYEGLIKSDFGDGKNWRVPSSADWESIFKGSRPGSVVTDANESVYREVRFLRTMLSEEDDALENGGRNGILVFPDNVAISAEFESFPPECINAEGTSFDTKGAAVVTKSNLEEMIAAGCTFIPTTGMLLSTNYSFSNGDKAANYYSSTEDVENPANAYRARLQNKKVDIAQSYAKDGMFVSVRLVRTID